MNGAAHVDVADELVQLQRAGVELVLFGGIVGPSDTFSVSPIVKSKLLWPYSPLAS